MTITVMETQKQLPSLLTLFDQTFSWYKINWQVFATIFLIPVVLSIIFTVLIQALGGTTMQDSSAITNAFKNATPGLVVLLVIQFIVLLAAQLWAHAAALFSLKKIEQEHLAPDFRDAYKMSKQFIIPLFITELITGLLVVAGFILLIIPGVILVVWGFAVSYMYMFEGKKYLEAFKASRELVKGYWWNVFIRLLIMGLAIGIFNFFANLLPYIGPVLTSIITTPMTIYFGYLLYKYLKEIKGSTQQATPVIEVTPQPTM